mmetsp:Transcript_1780/g.3133  ORF Transcript_1780/g.3133 Transcript_1780/m.3133 type:complete len:347 (-) Transcript_1780:1353-2393(-)
MNEMLYLQNLTVLRNQFLRNVIKLGKKMEPKEKAKVEKEQEKLIEQFKKGREEYFSKFPVKGSSDEKPSEKVGDPEVRYAYVVFRQTDAPEIALKAYDIGSFKFWLTMSCFGDCCCRRQKKSLMRKHLFKKWPQLEVAGEPDNIKWENLGYSGFERNLRSSISWLVALLLIAAALIGIVIFKEKTSELKEEFNTDITCPDDSLSFKEEAFNEFQKGSSGMMHCYCLAYLYKFNLAVKDVDFSEYLAGTDPSESRYCLDWFLNYSLQNGMVAATSVVVVLINIITCTIFERFVSFEKKHTANGETMSQFQKITYMQYINIAVVILIVNLDVLEGDAKLFGFLPILNG